MSTETENELPVRDDEDSLEELQTRSRLTGAELDPEDFEDVVDLDLVDTDPPIADLDIKIVPVQADEFTCTSCFLVFHRSQNTSKAGSPAVCRECSE